MRVIGFTGPDGAGKDTAAAMVAELYEGTVIRQGFADKLKLSAARIFFPDIDQADAIRFCDDLKSGGEIRVVAQDDAWERISGRRFLRAYGTEAHRDVFGSDFWLDAVLPLGVKVQTYSRDDCDLLLIPDVRFENEAQRIRDCGGEVWKVIRPEVSAVNDHSSEVAIPRELLSGYIRNGGTLDELRLQVAETILHRGNSGPRDTGLPLAAESTPRPS